MYPDVSIRVRVTWQYLIFTEIERCIYLFSISRKALKPYNINFRSDSRLPVPTTHTHTPASGVALPRSNEAAAWWWCWEEGGRNDREVAETGALFDDKTTDPSGRAHRGNPAESSGEVPSSIQERLQFMEDPNLQPPIRQGPPSTINHGSNLDPATTCLLYFVDVHDRSFFYTIPVWEPFCPY